jgi:hypothetical protein
MASDKIRMGVIGANIHRGWAPRSHLPAIVASPAFALTAVCTTRQESAEASAKRFGARLAMTIETCWPTRTSMRWPWCCGCRLTTRSRSTPSKRIGNSNRILSPSPPKGNPENPENAL